MLIFRTANKRSIFGYQELHSKPKQLLKFFSRQLVADIICIAEYRQRGLALCFPYQSARIDPVAISLF
jgi:hypothetical protein